MSRTTTPPSRRPWVILICCAALVIGIGTALGVVSRRHHSDRAPVVAVTGRSDASAVIDSARFEDPGQQHAYGVAHHIPATLNQLYCWCHCHESEIFHHRSLLECFESDHASRCSTCIGSAEIAFTRTNPGVTDIQKIQAAIDARFGPGARRT
ncbi:MAG: hypothetical protein ACREMO_01055 [Gemmatimonadales bacterium]